MVPKPTISNHTATEPPPAEQPKELHLPVGKQYMTETEVAKLLATSVRSLRQRENRPPAIQVSPRRRIYDPDEVASWIHSQPRVK
jgi:hypothetical protein